MIETVNESVIEIEPKIVFDDTAWGGITGNIALQSDLVAEFGLKVDKVTGKQLSTEDFTTAEKGKLSRIWSDGTVLYEGSTSIGNGAIASGSLTTAIGYLTAAKSICSTAIGSFNIDSGNPFQWVETDPIFTVGNGNPDGEASNALTILKNGNAIFAGNVIGASAKIGNVIDGNYTEFEADGTLKFNGTATVFKDVVIPFLYKGTGTEAVLATFVGGIKNLQFDVGKTIYLENAEAPHDYMQGSAIELHIHWAVNSAMIAGAKVQWQLECSFANMINGTNTGTIFCNPANPTVFGTKTMVVEYTSPVGGTPAGSNIYSSFGAISAADMANVKIGAGFLGTIRRIVKSAGGTDPSSNSVFGLNSGIHYEADTIGSRTTTSK